MTDLKIPVPNIFKEAAFFAKNRERTRDKTSERSRDRIQEKILDGSQDRTEKESILNARKISKRKRLKSEEDSDTLGQEFSLKKNNASEKKDIQLEENRLKNFGKIEKLKKESKNITKSTYVNNEVPYDNSKFPTVRFPTFYSVPTHLLDDFKNMFPEMKNKKGKKTLQPSMQIGGKASSLLQWLVYSHWKDHEYLDDLAKIILHKKAITLSNIDWLCTNFSKTFDVRYRLDQNNPVDFSVHESYNQRLELHLRAFFDVFARNLRILVEWETHDEEFFNSFIGDKPDNLDIKWDNKKNIGMRKVQGQMMVYLITSVGQLNFFTWAMQHKVIDYCINNADEIEEHYNRALQMPPPENGKRRKLSEASCLGFKVKRIDTVVQYENNVHTMIVREN